MIDEITKGDQSPIVSVIMPVYNREDFISQAITSIVNQTEQNLELIIIDDGSSDHSVEVAKSFTSVDRRIRLIENKINYGIATTRNIGITEAKGKYIAFMDSDDLSIPRRLEKQVDFLDNRPDIGFCGGWIVLFGGSRKMIIHYPANDEILRCSMLFRMSFANPTIMFRRDLLVMNNRLTFNSDYKMGSDYDFWINAMEITKAENLQEVLLWYRLHPKQIVVTEKLQELVITKNIHKKIFQSLNFEVSEKELGIHGKLWLDESTEDRKNLVDIESFLIRLLDFNKINHKYSVIKFQEEIFRIWTFTCLNSSIELKRAKNLFSSRIANSIPTNIRIHVLIEWFRNKIALRIAMLIYAFRKPPM